eukprot:COSAG01_NODE_2840_length_6992_cov_2.267228_6_plen_68_part_00
MQQKLAVVGSEWIDITCARLVRYQNRALWMARFGGRRSRFASPSSSVWGAAALSNVAGAELSDICST